MGIITQELYTVQCDNCKEVYSDAHSGIGFWISFSDAWEKANQDGWSMSDDEGCNKQFCSKCHQYNDDDEMIVGQNESIN